MQSTPNFGDISDNLSFLDDWEDRYRYIIELGQSLPVLDDEQKSADNKVHGCVSQVWLAAEPITSGSDTTILFRGDSDAMIVKGLVAVLIALYSGRPAAEISEIDAIAKLDELGLREHLTTQRSNGLGAMVERMRAHGRQYS